MELNGLCVGLRNVKSFLQKMVLGRELKVISAPLSVMTVESEIHDI